MVRLENIADFMIHQNETQTVNLTAICEGLYNSANSKNENLPTGQMSFIEKSISGNMPIGEMKSRKIQWKTVDDIALGRDKKSSDRYT